MNAVVRVGDPACEAYRNIILAQNDIASVQISRYVPPSPLQQRLALTEVERVLVDGALNVHSSGEMSFWSAIFTTSLNMGSCPERIIDAALFHSGPGSLELMSFSDFREANLDALLAGERSVGISSRLCRVNGSVVHLQLMDFHCRVSDTNRPVVEGVCARLFDGSYVLIDSGNSYHAVGTKVQSERERIAFLGRAVLFGPIVDVSYVGHQLLQDFSTIRISRGGKHGKLPMVIAVRNDRMAPKRG